MWLFLAFGTLVALFALAALLGAPYLPTRRPQVGAALKLLALKPGQTVLDLGSGDGCFLLAAAKQGIKGIGYEINPLLVVWSKLRLWPHRRLVSIKWRSYWGVKLPPADGIYVFLISHYMKTLDRKLKAELTRPTPVASYTFKIPGRNIEQSKAGVFLYRYPR